MKKLIKQSTLKSTEQFIKDADVHFKGLYDYSKTVYIGSKLPVTVTCPIHGDFQKRANRFIVGEGCSKCTVEKSLAKQVKEQTKSVEYRLEQFNKLHKGKYCYAKMNFVNMDTKIVIICPVHGEFLQSPKCHVDGPGCAKCTYADKRPKPSPQPLLCEHGCGKPAIHFKPQTPRIPNGRWQCDPGKNSCPAIIEKILNTACKRNKTYIMPSGMIHKIQGYEPWALDDLMSEGITENDLMIYFKHPVRYEFEDKLLSYYPDILVKSINTIFEVKSTYTYKKDLDKNLAKRKACIEQGYGFEFMIYDDKGRLLEWSLPS